MNKAENEFILLDESSINVNMITKEINGSKVNIIFSRKGNDKVLENVLNIIVENWYEKLKNKYGHLK